MGTTVKADGYNISIRTNDNYVLSVELGYNISSAIPKMSMKRPSDNKMVELSEHIHKNGDTGFVINIPASVLSTLSNGVYQYDCVLDLGNGSKTFLFGGTAAVTKGLA